MMNIPLFNQTNKDVHEGYLYNEAVRLSNEVRPKPYRPIKDFMGRVTGWAEAEWGFDPETAPYPDFTRWLNDNTIKKSESLFWHVIDIMIWRFEEKHTEIRNNLAPRHKTEFDLAVSENTKEVESLGRRGYQNMVRRDGSLTNINSKVLKLTNDRVKIVKK